MKPLPAVGLATLLLMSCAALVRAGDPPSSQGRLRDPAPHHDAFWYGRVGAGVVLGEERFGGAGFGFGRRIERGAVAADLRLFSIQNRLGGAGSYGHAWTVLTARGLYVARPHARRSLYSGAGLGYGGLAHGGEDAFNDWRGHGWQGELTAGYALARSPHSPRFFLEVDATLPAYGTVPAVWIGPGRAERRERMLTCSVGAGF